MEPGLQIGNELQPLDLMLTHQLLSLGPLPVLTQDDQKQSALCHCLLSSAYLHMLIAPSAWELGV